MPVLRHRVQAQAGHRAEGPPLTRAACHRTTLTLRAAHRRPGALALPAPAPLRPCRLLAPLP
ncbi:hypothetical protein CBM2588_A40340 [Cupriavidus taiwanensis]|nr:hypothetical protein CBM2588_A40340 [Cupriavidus taiwanensis]SOZ61644.1 hypothetical protein CBM2617_A40312 [Cupriavidus taiwanensis]SOZ81729.1 hypothetical protein CBM2618_A50314 [Cupriavidus taiwanensis]SOZ82999.1 hypothetical protein CBM2622_A50316 [Cupriavidus taiwanensis]SOZ91361.1 hypothetical protein CBM2621_A50312 [Cupriavidus taiwanensis]